MAKGLTFKELKDFCDKLTPAQLVMRVMWSGDAMGGVVHAVEILDEDHINPSGDGMEPRRHAVQYLVDEEGMTEEDAKEQLAGERVVAAKDQPILWVD